MARNALTLASGSLRDTPLKARRGHAGGLSERRRERARFAESHVQSDRGDRCLGIRQQCLGALDATVRVESMGRHAEGLLECPAEMVRAQASELGEGGERDLVGDML